MNCLIYFQPHKEAAKKLFFNDRTIKSLPPPPSSLMAGRQNFFLKNKSFKKVIFNKFLMACPLPSTHPPLNGTAIKNTFFRGFPKMN